MKLRFALGVAGICVCAMTASASYWWWDTTDDDFGDPANWSESPAVHFAPSQPPGPDDHLFFNRDAATAYTVTLNEVLDEGDPVVRTFLSMAVQDDKVLFNLDGNAMSLTQTGTSPYSLSVANGADLAGELDIYGGADGADSSVQTIGVGIGEDAVGTLRLEGSNTNVAQWSTAQIGDDGGTGYLVLTDGARLTTPTGQQSAVNFGDTNGSDGHLAIDGGARLDGGEGTVSFYNDSTAVVSDSGSRLDRRNIYLYGNTVVTAVDRGYLRARMHVVLTNEEGEVNRLELHDGGTLTWVDGSVQIATGSDSTSYVDVRGISTDGDDVASILRMGNNRSVFVGGSDTADGGTGFLTVADGGEVSIRGSGKLHLWNNGTLDVDDGLVETASLEATAGSIIALTLHTGKFGAQIHQDTAGGSVLLDTDGDGVEFKLSLAGGFTADVFDIFEVIRFDGSRTGTFAGLADGADLWDEDDQYHFRINYGTAPGYDDAITLTVIPEPHTLGLLLAAGALLALRRRKK